MKTNKIVALALAAILALSLMTTAFAAFKGDVDSNGTINSSDALAVLKYSVELITEIDEKVADMDANGVINSSDALAILRISVGLDEKEELPEEPDVPDTPDTPDTPAVPDAPTSTEEIVTLYNNAVNKVVDEKAGYKKERTTTVSEMNGGALMKIQLVVDMVNEFLGVGTKEYVNTKGQSLYLMNASLEASDIKSASCEKIGDNYTVTLNLNNGNSSATAAKKKDSSPVARSGLLTGDVASPDYDYLSSGCVYASISGVDDVSVKSIKATNSNVKIVAVVDAEDKLISLVAAYDWTVEMENIKYTIVSVKKADGKAHTAVEISDVKW
ncbi:MAG: dockerin type I repeat-containing protein [Clostridia bacterium]|nr:dockerin type I repeat-containing protein [Clostridia bacterium]